MAGAFAGALSTLTGDESADAETAARLAYSRAVTSRRVLADGAGVITDEAEPIKRATAREVWSDVIGTTFPLDRPAR